MLLAHTINQLAIGHVPDQRALEMGHLGYLQWLGALRDNANYVREAQRAYDAARPFVPTSPAVAVFCSILLASIAKPVSPLGLRFPARTRRGGARARRQVL